MTSGTEQLERPVEEMAKVGQLSTRPLCFLDIESTGPDADSDRIVELCILREGRPTLVRRVDPGMPIPRETSEIHGIYDADVVGLSPFATYAAEVQELVHGTVLVGYNLRRFDSIVLHRELRRGCQAGLEVDEYGRLVHPEIDLFGMWQRLENRKLVTAAKRFAGVDLENAHSAAADTVVLPAIMAGMIDAFQLGNPSFEKLVELSIPEGAIDRDGKFRRREDGVVVFTIGATTRDQPVLENPGMLDWMLTRDFSADTKYWARKFLMEAYS